jgi:hypothetical protein
MGIHTVTVPVLIPPGIRCNKNDVPAAAGGGMMHTARHRHDRGLAVLPSSVMAAQRSVSLSNGKIIDLKQIQLIAWYFKVDGWLSM